MLLPSRKMQCHSKRYVIAVAIVIIISVYIVVQSIITTNTSTSTNVHVHSNDKMPHQTNDDITHRHNAAEILTRELLTPLPVTKPEVRHIGFLKVHKAASSTMQNIFYRFGLRRNLTFVFTKHPNYFSRTSTSHIPLVPPKYRSGYDILCNHGVFNKEIYSSLLPNDTVYLGIVRDPLEVFVSAVNYYTKEKMPHLVRISGNKLQKLIEQPEMYDAALFSYTRNVMARDFGFPKTTDEQRVTSYLEKIDSIFTLVLIVEQFEESLVLMKRYLHWGLEDILFLSNNVYGGKGGSVSDLTPKQVELFKQRNSLDYIVYDHFYKKFQVQLAETAADFDDEVLQFKSMLAALKTFCNSDTNMDNSVLEFTKTKYNNHFEVHKNDCDLMKEAELKFITMLRKIQGSEL